MLYGYLNAQPIKNIKFDRLTSEKITIEKGLSQNTGQCILQDSKGFMWFGTWDGLNKYDGYTFTIYNSENGLSNTTINCLAEDDEKNLWIGTEFGLNKMNLETGEIEIILSSSDNPNSLSHDFITDIIIDHKCNLWIATAKGLNHFNKEYEIFTSYNFYYQKTDSLTSNYVNNVFEDRENNIWIGTRNGLKKYNPEERKFTFYQHDPDNEESLSNNLVLEIFQDHLGFLWIGTNDGLNRLDPDTEIFERFYTNPEITSSPRNNIMNTLYEDPNHNLWLGTSYQLVVYNQTDNSIQRFRNTNNSTSLSNNDIRCIYQDKTGTMWIGTYMGINKVDESPSRFTHYYQQSNVTNTLSNNIVYGIIQDDKGLIWIATYDGLNILDREHESFSIMRAEEGNPNSLSSNKLKTILQDRKGNYWIGTERSGVNVIDKKTGNIKVYKNNPADSTSLSDNSIISMFEDSKGRIWVGSGKGADVYNEHTDSFFNIRHHGNNPKSLSNNRVWCIYEDSQGFFWIGTDYGLNKLNENLEVMDCFIFDPDKTNCISGNRIFSVYEDAEGIFWIGAMGTGLNRYDPATGEFKIFTEVDGLPNNVVYTTIEDDEGNLWISTNWGLSKFNKATETFVNYGVRDGVQGNEFNIGAQFKNKEGELFFGGMNGFNSFFPVEIQINKNIPDIVITRFRVFNEIQPYELRNNDTLFLNHDDNFFSFEFAALDYTNPSKNNFRFRLENYETDWTSQDASQRIAEYKRVSPGTYVFKVIGSNNDGVWNTDGISVTVIISPPWWDRWTFRILFAILLITVFWFLLYQRFKNIKKKHEVEKKVLTIEKQVFELEQKALQLQMNPHFIFNSLNAIQSFVISDEAEKAVHYLAKFSHLMRMILANSSETYISLKDDLRALQYYLDIEMLRFENKFEYSIDVDDEIDDDFIEIPPMILQPYVENAIIHGLGQSTRKGKLDIILKLKSDSLFCIIQDNGIGREKAIQIREQSGIKRQPKGMIITKERLEILNKQNMKEFSVRVIDMKDENGEPTGTRVEIMVHYKEI